VTSATRTSPSSLGQRGQPVRIGMISARIAEIVLRDERAVLPVGSYSKRFGVTLSLPRCWAAAEMRRPSSLSSRPKRKRLLARGAETLRKAAAGAPARRRVTVGQRAGASANAPCPRLRMRRLVCRGGVSFSQGPSGRQRSISAGCAASLHLHDKEKRS